MHGVIINTQYHLSTYCNYSSGHYLFPFKSMHGVEEHLINLLQSNVSAGDEFVSLHGVTFCFEYHFPITSGRIARR